MKPNTGKAERTVRAGLGLIITVIGAYALTLNLWLGAVVTAVGLFTVYEGASGWTFLRAFWGTSSAPETAGVPDSAYDLLWGKIRRGKNK